MDEAKQLRSIISCRTKQKLHEAGRLSDYLSELMDNQITPQQQRLQSVVRMFNQLLPPELATHCKVDGISGGQLKVLVDSPAHMYQLQLCSYRLLKELQHQCPRARIKSIKPVVG